MVKNVGYNSGMISSWNNDFFSPQIVYSTIYYISYINRILPKGNNIFIRKYTRKETSTLCESRLCTLGNLGLIQRKDFTSVIVKYQTWWIWQPCSPAGSPTLFSLNPSSHLLSSPKPIDWAQKTDSTLLLLFWLMPKSHVAIQNMSQITKNNVENFLVSDFEIFFSILLFL